MENGKTLIVALVALIPVALWSATGIEVDESKSGAECQAPRASSQSHLKVTAWELKDQTDGVGELVQTREWLLLPGTVPVEDGQGDCFEAVFDEGGLAATAGGHAVADAGRVIRPALEAPVGAGVVRHEVEGQAFALEGDDAREVRQGRGKENR